jgi:hypothetical protein
MHDTEAKGIAALSGGLIAALAHWQRHDDDMWRRQRNTRLDLGEVRDALQTLIARGDMIRLRMPAVEDAQVGIALANPVSTPSAVVPSVPKLTRPEIGSDAVNNLSWPPKVGVYDDQGNVSQLGELTLSNLALTFEEVRAFIIGLALARSPTQAAKEQIFTAAHELAEELITLNLTAQQYRDAWHRVFTGSGLVSAGHRDPGLPPVVVPGTLNANVASVVALTSLNGGPGAYANRNTDESSRWRITAGANPVGAGQAIAQFRFGSEFRYRDGSTLVAYQPSVITNQTIYQLYADAITSTGFTLYTFQSVPANAVIDVSVTAIGGIS